MPKSFKDIFTPKEQSPKEIKSELPDNEDYKEIIAPGTSEEE